MRPSGAGSGNIIGSSRGGCMSQFTLGVVNVGGGECRGGECRTIPELTVVDRVVLILVSC